MTGMTQPHLDPAPIPLIKEKHNGKSCKYFVALKLRIYPTSSIPDLYEFKISLPDNGELEDYFLFVRNFNMTLAASETLEAGEKYQYLLTLVHREVLRQFDLLSADVEGTNALNIDHIIRGLAYYPPPVNYLSKQKRAMCRVI